MYLTSPFTILEPLNPGIEEFYRDQEHGPTDFKAPAKGLLMFDRGLLACSLCKFMSLQFHFLAPLCSRRLGDGCFIEPELCLRKLGEFFPCHPWSHKALAQSEGIRPIISIYSARIGLFERDFHSLPVEDVLVLDY